MQLDIRRFFYVYLNNAVFIFDFGGLAVKIEQCSAEFLKSVLFGKKLDVNDPSLK